MFQAAREFKIGRPQIFAGLMLLAFVAQCLWASNSRKLSELEKVYIANGMGHEEPVAGMVSPMTAWAAALPLHVTKALQQVAPVSLHPILAVPRPWLLRFPFLIFGVWLGSALWWVARRLFGDSGGYVALGLYCSSPATVMISSNIGPEIILAWSIFGLIYTAIGVAHTVYAPPRKWAPRILILGLAIGFAISTALWSATVVLLALAFMIYLGPGRRVAALMVLTASCVLALGIFGLFSWATATPFPALWVPPKLTMNLMTNLNFFLADDYALTAFFVAALTAYGSSARIRYFGNTAPLLASFTIVLLFALTPGLRLWGRVLGLSFVFVFVGGVTADLLETGPQRVLTLILSAGFLFRVILGIRSVWIYWVKQNQL